MTTPYSLGGTLDELEVTLLLEGIHRHYGYDFRNYARSSLNRRIRHRMREEGVGTVTGLLERVLHEPSAVQRLLYDLSVNVTAMFRDPSFYVAFREKVVPVLRTYPFLRIWNAGCSSGEETYSLAILLDEEGLLDSSRIYATDMNDAVLDRARAGEFPLDRMRDYTANYIGAGGRRAFSEYYTAGTQHASFDRRLIENVVFAQHNLVSDRSFNEFHAIVCRNVLIYFDHTLQARVQELFHDSLVMFGVLGLGSKESIRGVPERCYEPVDSSERLFRKVR